MRKFSILIFLSFIQFFSFAQDKLADSADSIATNKETVDSMRLKPKYGLFGAFNYNLHFANFRNLPDVPCCAPVFENGSGVGFKLGAIYESPID